MPDVHTRLVSAATEAVMGSDTNAKTIRYLARDEQDRPMLKINVYNLAHIRHCRICGCTDDDCRDCIEATGQPCHWVAKDLCSRCKAEQEAAAAS